MRLLDRQLLRELRGPFIFGVAAFTSVFFAGTYLLKLTNWMMNGMPVLTAIEVVILYLPSIIVYTLPMATLLSVLLGLGRLSSDSEATALFAGGISLYRLAVPIFAVGLVVSAASILLNEVVSPRANIRNKALQAAAFKEAGVTERPFMVFDEGTGSLIRVNGGMDQTDGTLRDITIVQFIKGRPGVVIYAATARWAGLKDPEQRYRWKLYDGYWQLVGTASPAMSSFGESRTREIEIQKTPEQLALYQKDPEQMSFSELTDMVSYLKAHPDRPLDQIRELDVDRWNKLALPLSSLVFAMLATPLAIRTHRSASSVGMGMSIFVLFIYWMTWHYTSSLAVQGNAPPVVGAFAADVLGIVAGLVLLKRAST